MPATTAWSLPCVVAVTSQQWCSISRSSELSGCSQMPGWCLPFGTVQSADVSDLQRYTDSITRLGREAGAQFVSVAPPSVMERAREALIDRKSTGLSDTMEFTFRNPERSTDPGRAVSGARAVIVAAMPYGTDTPAPPNGPHGVVAQYARQNYYGRLSEALNVMRDKLRADGFKALDFVDDNSMVDREISWLGGLGWFEIGRAHV